MARCAGIKRDGGRCEAVVSDKQTYCYHHDPANAEKRRRVASKGGRSKSSREIQGFKQEVRDLIANVKMGAQDRADAMVLLQAYRLLKDFIELERRVKETDDLAARIEELEQDINQRNGGKRWGT